MKKLSLVLAVVSCLTLLPNAAHGTFSFPFIESVTVDNSGNGALTISGHNFCTTPTPSVTLADTPLSVQSGFTATQIAASFPAQTPLSSFKTGSYFLSVSCGWTFAIFEVAIGATGPQGQTRNFQVFTADGNFVVPNGVNTIQIEAVGAGGPGGSGGGIVPGGSSNPGGGGGGSGAYEKVVLSVVSSSTYTITIGISSGQTTTLVKDQTGKLVACGSGGESGIVNGPGLGGLRAISCPDFLLPAPNRLDIDGQIGQPGQVLPVSIVITAGSGGIGTGQVGLPGNGGPSLMFGAGAGGAGAPVGAVPGSAQLGTNGIVVISW